ncbi:hypothetical protein [Escherichia fergusonii]|uniref:hypothetical protein n=1 Tax=Escherichia fergusonii TaxID=564 RepID=UPI00061462BD|nr:hypothetical protein [Escherichia fergusonii]EFL4477867.1 hypothetical protein [Escherichia fergusonii]KWW00910.1 hypothetical protein VK87_0215155 [Escherichia fergusonii]MBA5613462.1 hypothetical protein [Escherichia fergusonii]MBA5662734.1 hypothetical protein [Escherichia fergusonii]MBA8157256.1 hypothetical protein [Escherichia fergusonii]
MDIKTLLLMSSCLICLPEGYAADQNISTSFTVYSDFYINKLIDLSVFGNREKSMINVSANMNIAQER